MSHHALDSFVSVRRRLYKYDPAGALRLYWGLSGNYITSADENDGGGIITLRIYDVTMLCKQKLERGRFHVRLRRPGFKRRQVGVSDFSAGGGGTQQRRTSPRSSPGRGPTPPVIRSVSHPVASVHRRDLAAYVRRRTRTARVRVPGRRGRPRLPTPHRRRHRRAGRRPGLPGNERGRRCSSSSRRRDVQHRIQPTMIKPTQLG